MMEEIIQNALKEDIGNGDHSTLACIPADAFGEAKLLAKEDGVFAGEQVLTSLFAYYDPNLTPNFFKKDGDSFVAGDILMVLQGSSRSILTTERIALNIAQRMSAIATMTSAIVKRTKHTGVKILDTRKTTPGIRALEKMAVAIGGGENHRFGLYDMIMLKDNHIDYAGGVRKAIQQTKRYLTDKKLDLKIIVEIRSESELKTAIEEGGVYRLLLDNFKPEELKELLKSIPEEIQTEASGGITIENVVDFAETGVGYISMGALTHSVRNLDMSLKAIF